MLVNVMETIALMPTLLRSDSHYWSHVNACKMFEMLNTISGEMREMHRVHTTRKKGEVHVGWASYHID